MKKIARHNSRVLVWNQTACRRASNLRVTSNRSRVIGLSTRWPGEVIGIAPCQQRHDRTATHTESPVLLVQSALSRRASQIVAHSRLAANTIATKSLYIEKR